MTSEFEKIYSEIPLSGRYIFRDDFDDLEEWNIIAGSPATSGSILTLPPGAEIRTKKKFLYGFLVIVARSTAAGSLQIGFDEGGDDKFVWQGGYMRYNSTVDPTEGTTSCTITETNYNIFAFLWESDNIVLWVNGSPYGPYQSVKVPNKPLPICIKNVGSGDVLVDLVVLYPELAGVWLGVGAGSVSQSVSVPIYIAGAGNSATVNVAVRVREMPYTDTTTPLGANATYTGASRDTFISTNFPYPRYALFMACALADQAGTLYIDESPDNTTWINGVKSASVAANTPTILEHKPIYRYVRVRYVNGATAQTSFRLWSVVQGLA
ncbi:MAG: hypothetical protein QXO67_03810 [Candidatus Bathyarchaeia archaeon]